nr:calcium-binding protein 1-like [Macaca nemestrina]
MGNCVKSPLRNLSRKMCQEEQTSYMVVQTSEEGLAADTELPGPLLMLAQNCAVMHNLLGPACIFLRKGFAENRQPVRKLAQWSPLNSASQGVRRCWEEEGVYTELTPPTCESDPQSFPLMATKCWWVHIHQQNNNNKSNIRYIVMSTY